MFFGLCFHISSFSGLAHLPTSIEYDDVWNISPCDLVASPIQASAVAMDLSRRLWRLVLVKWRVRYNRIVFHFDGLRLCRYFDRDPALSCCTWVYFACDRVAAFCSFVDTWPNRFICLLSGTDIDLVAQVSMLNCRCRRAILHSCSTLNLSVVLVVSPESNMDFMICRGQINPSSWPVVFFQCYILTHRTSIWIATNMSLGGVYTSTGFYGKSWYVFVYQLHRGSDWSLAWRRARTGECSVSVLCSRGTNHGSNGRLEL